LKLTLVYDQITMLWVSCFTYASDFTGLPVIEFRQEPSCRREADRTCLRPKASKCERSFLLTSITCDIPQTSGNAPKRALKIAAKPLHIATLLPGFDAYRNSPTPCLTVPSPTVYDLPFRIQTTDRQTDDRPYHKR